MTFLVIIAILFFTIATPIVAWSRHYSYNKQLLSKPARDTLRMYRSLPADSRVISEWELKSTLHALDTKNDNDHKKIESHFSVVVWDTMAYSFPKPTTNCNHGRYCAYSDYADLYNELAGIKESLRQREHQMKVAVVSTPLNDVNALTERLREERDLIQNVTKEICS